MFGGYLVETYSFLMRDRKKVDPDERGGEEELTGAEGGETLIRRDYMTKESIFDKRKIESYVCAEFLSGGVECRIAILKHCDVTVF